MKAFILAAGVSRRLYPETYNTPKCLLDVGGKPIINYQLEAIQNIGIQEVTMIVGYHREMLIKHVIETFPGLSFEFIINNHYFEAGIEPLLKEVDVYYSDVSDLPCLEIDFIEDLNEARSLF